MIELIIDGPKKRFIVVAALCLWVMACGTPPPAKKAPTPTPPPVTRLHAEPIKVDKPVNVSFSTYSKEWPVGWQWIDPEEANDPTPHDVRSGVLRVTVASKRSLDGSDRSAPRYVKAITGDFQIETRVRFRPKENYQGAGLLIYNDDNAYLRFERAYGGSGGGGEGIRIDVRQGDEDLPILTPADLQTEATEVDLRIVRSGRVFTAYWRLDEESEWREVGEYESSFPDTILAGVTASNTARPITAEFAYIRLLPGLKP